MAVPVPGIAWRFMGICWHSFRAFIQSGFGWSSPLLDMMLLALAVPPDKSEQTRAQYPAEENKKQAGY
jgi:hypothetical protein